MASNKYNVDVERNQKGFKTFLSALELYPSDFFLNLECFENKYSILPSQKKHMEIYEQINWKQ